LTGISHLSNDQANSNEVMTFYQTKRFDSVPIDTIEVEDDDEVQSHQYGKVIKQGVEMPMLYNN
jgi:hypothetical protein